MKVLMTGVDKNRLGGMWTVANNYITSKEYNKKIDLTYIATSTNGSIVKRTLLMIKAFNKVKKELSKNKYDLVHIHMAEKGSVFRARIITKIAKKNNIKVVIHMHAGPFINWYSSLNDKKQKQVKELLDLADRVMVLGKYWKKSLSEIVDDKKIRVLYNGVHVPKSNNYNTNGKYITYMGVLKKEKGIYDLIDAIGLIDKKLDKSIIIKLCGIDLEGNIQEYINNKELNNRFDLAGWVDAKERDSIYKNTVLNLLPSYFEALSMTVIESMANGIPIITTSISTMNEVLDNKDLLIKPGDTKELSNKIIDYINNKDLRKKVSNNLYKRAKATFSCEDMINNTLNIYMELIKK